MADTYPRLLPLGDLAWIVEFGAAIDEVTHARVMGFAQLLEEGRAAGLWPQVVEWVPAYTTVTVFFAGDDAAEHSAASEAAPALLAAARGAAPLTRPGRRWRLPVCFDAEFAPDLEDLAHARGLAPDEVCRSMTQTAFRVYMLGFQPGFPYMGGLPAALEMPRRKVPRTDVPARSVAVAGRMCAVYPWRSPGGWHLLGRTPLALFDRRLGDPAWLHPGDEVHWLSIDRARFDALQAEADAGSLRREEWLWIEAAS